MLLKYCLLGVFQQALLYTDWKYVIFQLRLRLIGINIFIHRNLPMYQIQNIELF
jgi:hypothetical protein